MYHYPPLNSEQLLKILKRLSQSSKTIALDIAMVFINSTLGLDPISAITIIVRSAICYSRTLLVHSTRAVILISE
jgi:hypothetical protein